MTDARAVKRDRLKRLTFITCQGIDVSKLDLAS
jgi:hypothetical protein